MQYRSGVLPNSTASSIIISLDSPANPNANVIYPTNRNNCVSKNTAQLRPRNREYFQLKQEIKKNILSSTLCDSGIDNRPYADVEIAGIPFRGLLDSGASITVLGKGSEIFLKNSGVRFYHFPSMLSTASGDKQRIIGHIQALISFAGKQRMMRIFIAPGLTQSLYLGIDFWNKFKIAPRFVEDLSLGQQNPYLKTTIFQRNNRSSSKSLLTRFHLTLRKV